MSKNNPLQSGCLGGSATGCWRPGLRKPLKDLEDIGTLKSARKTA